MGTNFIKAQKADAAAAFTRASIVRRHMKELEAEINATNTVDIAEEHMDLYEEFYQTARLICLQEQMLINQGE